MQIAAKPLARAQRVLKTVMPSKPVQPILGSVLLQDGQLSATDLETAITIRVSEPNGVPPVLLPWAILRGMKGALDVAYEAPEPAAKTDADGHPAPKPEPKVRLGAVTAPALDVADYPKIAPAPADTDGIQVGTEALLQHLRRAAVCAAEEGKGRAILTAVGAYPKDSPHHGTICATDGFCAYVAKESYVGRALATISLWHTAQPGVQIRAWGTGRPTLDDVGVSEEPPAGYDWCKIYKRAGLTVADAEALIERHREKHDWRNSGSITGHQIETITVAQDHGLFLPARVVKVLAACDLPETVTIARVENFFHFTWSNGHVAIRGLEGVRYPTVDDLVPKQFLIRVHVRRQELIAACEQVVLPVKKEAPHCVVFSWDDSGHTMRLSARNIDGETAELDIQAMVEGPALKLGMDAVQLLAGLKGVVDPDADSAGEIVWEVAGQKTVTRIATIGGHYLQMPLAVPGDE